ncbi:hypothetical protein [Marivivens marinus]|uniref:hypothetical protein n=1 Tax=Marivivens marinus TaxID=3110173 RepID=UPI003B847B00
MTKTFLSALSLAALLPLSAVADSISGTYDNTLDTLYAVSQPGSRAPDGDSYCKETFGKFVGSTVSGTYDINTTTLMMSATATFEGSEASMFPLGISGRYAFMTDGVPAPLSDMGVNRIILNLSTDFSDKESDVLFNGNADYNCLLSNRAAN